MNEKTPAAGHNSQAALKTKLLNVVERAENLIAEKKAIQEDLTDLFKEAKENDIDTKAVREMIRLRNMDKGEREAREQVIDEYRLLLGLD